jgi:hypothetical protein
LAFPPDISPAPTEKVLKGMSCFCFSILESWAGRGISYTGSLLLSQCNWAFGFVYPSSFLFSCHWFAQACSD